MFEVSSFRSLIAGIIAGPTASGKSALAVEVARAHGLSIISGDSMQVYRGMTIGTGAASPAEQGGVPHALIGVAAPGEEFHAARFLEAAERAAFEAWEKRCQRSLVVGGTGMWLQALREGLFEGPGRSEEVRDELRDVLEREGPRGLHELLAEVDPPMAAQLSPADHVRVLRSIEVYFLTQRRHSDWIAEDRERRAALGKLIPLYVIERPREELYERINRRVEQMIAAGWLDEARALKALELPDHSPAKKALGYRELFRVIDGELPLADAITEIQAETRRFAKRQMTWFRAQREVQFDAEPTAERCARMLGL